MVVVHNLASSMFFWLESFLVWSCSPGKWRSSRKNSLSEAKCDRDQHFGLQRGSRPRRFLPGLTLSGPAEVHGIPLQAAGRHVRVCLGYILFSVSEGACGQPGQINRRSIEEGEQEVQCLSFHLTISVIHISQPFLSFEMKVQVCCCNIKDHTST